MRHSLDYRFCEFPAQHGRKADGGFRLYVGNPDRPMCFDALTGPIPKKLLPALSNAVDELKAEVERLEEIALHTDEAMRCECCEAVFVYDDLTPGDEGDYYCSECAKALIEMDRGAPDAS